MRERCINNEGLEDLLTINKYYELIPIDLKYGTVLSDKGMPIKVDKYRFEVHSDKKDEYIELESDEAILIINYLVELIGNKDIKTMDINKKKDFILSYIKEE